MKIAISQPRYLPAIIYLQRIYASDKFVILDDVQHSREFENRNYIKTPQGKKWLTIPCSKKGKRMTINDLEISSNSWIDKHKNIIEMNYKKSKFYSKEILDKIYDLDMHTNNFSKIIFQHIQNILELFDIKDNLILSSSLNIESTKAQKLYDICDKLGATTYISGINGKNYIKDEFNDISIEYHEYIHPKYPQLWGDFLPWMGFVDNLFNVGLFETKKMIMEDICLKKY